MVLEPWVKQGQVHTKRRIVSTGLIFFFGTFAKSMAGIGGFVASSKEVVDYLRYNMRSQIFAKALPMPMVIGIKKRFETVKIKT